MSATSPVLGAPKAVHDEYESLERELYEVELTLPASEQTRFRTVVQAFWKDHPWDADAGRDSDLTYDELFWSGTKGVREDVVGDLQFVILSRGWGDRIVGDVSDVQTVEEVDFVQRTQRTGWERHV